MGKKTGKTGFTEELSAFLLGWSLLLWVCIHTGFPSALAWGCVTLSDLKHENGSGSTEVSSARSWCGASKSLKPAGNASCGNEYQPCASGPVYLYLPPAELRKVK